MTLPDKGVDRSDVRSWHSFNKLADQKIKNQMQFKPVIFLFFTILFTAQLAEAQRTTLLIGSWSDEDYHGRESFDKILIVAIGPNALVRRTFEEDMADRLGSRKISVIKSLDVLPAGERIDSTTFDKYFDRQEIDAVLVTRVVQLDQLPDVPMGGTGAADFYGHYENVYVPSTEGGGMSMSTAAKVETNLYDIETRDLVWTCQTKSFSQGYNLEKVIKDVAKLVQKELKKFGYLKGS